MSILTGYAISTGFLGTDHTYVTSDNPPFVWPCWGRGAGGKMICRGNGNSSVANCISQPNSYAGIVYGVTGVCHQTANRILFPAGVTVSKAGGYWASSLAYGIYGTNFPEFLARLATCNTLLASPALKGKASVKPLEMDTRAQSHSIDDLENAYVQKIVAVYTEHMQMPHSSSTIMKEESSSLLGKELELTMEFRLGGNLDSQITKSVLKKQADFLKEKGEMDRELYSTDLSIEKYVKEVNDLFGDLFTSLPEFMGKDKYEKIFDLVPSKDRFVLIDPDIAVKAHIRS
jgi:hypothetical protein